MCRLHPLPAGTPPFPPSIHAAIQTLANNPERCPQADEAADLGIDLRELRELLSGRRRHVFRILFAIDASTVNIHYIRHAAQDRLTEDDVSKADKAPKNLNRVPTRKTMASNMLKS